MYIHNNIEYTYIYVYNLHFNFLLDETTSLLLFVDGMREHSWQDGIPQKNVCIIVPTRTVRIVLRVRLVLYVGADRKFFECKSNPLKSL